MLIDGIIFAWDMRTDSMRVPRPLNMNLWYSLVFGLREREQKAGRGKWKGRTTAVFREEHSSSHHHTLQDRH